MQMEITLQMIRTKNEKESDYQPAPVKPSSNNFIDCLVRQALGGKKKNRKIIKYFFFLSTFSFTRKKILDYLLQGRSLVGAAQGRHLQRRRPLLLRPRERDPRSRSYVFGCQAQYPFSLSLFLSSLLFIT